MPSDDASQQDAMMLLVVRRIIELSRITGTPKEEALEINARALNAALDNGTANDAELQRKLSNIKRIIDEVYSDAH